MAETAINVASLARLKRIAEKVRGNAKLLAVTDGVFHGTNDFGLGGPSLWNAYALEIIQRDLIAITIVRTVALLSVTKGSTDATLQGAYEIATRPGMEGAMLRGAREWIPELATGNERQARRHLDAFIQMMPTIDVERIKHHRDWAIAHSTTKKPPKVILKEVWTTATAVLAASDHLCFFAIGAPEDNVGVSAAYRESSLEYWKALHVGRVEPGKAG